MDECLICKCKRKMVPGYELRSGSEDYCFACGCIDHGSIAVWGVKDTDFVDVKQYKTPGPIFNGYIGSVSLKTEHSGAKAIYNWPSCELIEGLTQ